MEFNFSFDVHGVVGTYSLEHSFVLLLEIVLHGIEDGLSLLGLEEMKFIEDSGEELFNITVIGLVVVGCVLIVEFEDVNTGC